MHAMRALRGLLFRIRALLNKDRLEQDMAEELQSHLEFEVEQGVRRGMGLEEARRAANLHFGSVERTKEECRDAWGVRVVETLIQDVRVGGRRVSKKPGYTTAVVLALGLGIGANTAVFGVIRGVFL